MPIKPENRKRYPPHWKEIVRECRDRSGEFCQWCGAQNGQPHPRSGSKVVLTTAHLDHMPEHNEPENLALLCQRCHNLYDAPHRAESRRQTRAKALPAGQRDLFEEIA